VIGFRAFLAALAAILAMSCTGSTHSPSAKTTPGGSPASPGTGWVEPFADISFVSPTQGWAVVLSQADHAVETIHTVDGGATWSRPVKVSALDVPSGSAPPHAVIRFADPQTGWISATGSFWTADGGKTWNATSLEDPIFDIAVVGGTAWAVTGCDFRQGQCPAGLRVWVAQTHEWRATAHQPPMTSGPALLIRTSERRAFIAQQAELDNRLMRTDDGGNTWSQLPSPCRGFGMPVATVDGMHLWLACPSQPAAGQQEKAVYTSADGGSTWTLRAQTDPPGSVGHITTSGYAQLLAVTPSGIGFLALDRGDLYRSVDSGATWVATGITASEGFYPAIDFVDANHGWVVAETGEMDCCVGLYRTVDGGFAWKLVSSLPGRV
jgi:photosystem II stability/assembly factor-like uncharacterized protein